MRCKAEIVLCPRPTNERSNLKVNFPILYEFRVLSLSLSLARSLRSELNGHVVPPEAYRTRANGQKSFIIQKWKKKEIEARKVAGV